MSYVESNLVPGETVIYQTRLHWIVMLGHVFVGCLLLGLPGVLLLYYAYSQHGMDANTLRLTEGGGVALLVCGVIVLLIGMVRRKTTEMLLNKVESIEVSETTPGRMLGYGTIVMIGTGGTSEPFRKMAHPLEFRSHVQQQIEKVR